MAESGQLGLPLLAAAQAQKHVTVNEALVRLDGLVPMVLVSRAASAPPVTPEEGAVWAVPAGAGGDWAGQDWMLAIRSNGGWIFVAPRVGWRAFILDEGLAAIHDGTDWVAGALSLGLTGAATLTRVIEVVHAVSAGTSSSPGFLIPAGAVVLGITARVTAAITGALSGWRLGNPGADDRYGSGLGIGLGSWARGVLGQPMAFYAPTQVILTAEGGSFAGGEVALAVHVIELGLPR
ncbi:DUF2793 domain-containing protein [Frigidibacter sp. MR17.14]|uniref:DUF2793 domain-containing protein n=1 Tax=Frigidibacter sp. MR17.14 TaxID=3126509 RepID=UPI003012CE5E